MSDYINYNGEIIEYSSEAKAVQKIMLEMLELVHEICVKNDINYWLHGGTLLGCIRHNGFIPWDDDCDIAMPRKDYEKFLSIAQQLLPPEMFLQTKETDKQYPLNFAKIRKLGTKIIEMGETGDELYNQGIFIDIFPFDYYSKEWFIKWMGWSVTFRDKRKKYSKGSTKRFLITFYTNFIMAVPVHISVCIRKILSKYHYKFFSNDDFKFLTNGLQCGGYPHITEKKDILPVVTHGFENIKFNVPKNSTKYLETSYGPNWKELPKPEHRKIHAKKIYFVYPK